ncbi:unnamed protein product [Ilex paraguariensis]|uniref:Uncharacterized protein n=1 Tax=Ilex paraguariensis TaxID=185542 RepID=A0ABC8SPN3_9AQUA
MEKEEKNQRPCKPPETDLLLQWGNRKRLRCVRVRDPDVSDPSNSGRIRRKISSRFLTLSRKRPLFLHHPVVSPGTFTKTIKSQTFFFSQIFPEN